MSEAKMKKPTAIANAIIAAALLLPLAGLGISWAQTHSAAKMGTDWDIPVRGYDPRDLLRGHYIEFEYDWPGIEDDESGEGRRQSHRTGFAHALCIKGTAPNITSVSKIRSDRTSEPECTSIVRADKWSEEYDYSMTRDRLFIPQTKGKALDKKLRDPKLQGVIRARIRDDGKITPISISFRTNPNAGEVPVTDVPPSIIPAR